MPPRILAVDHHHETLDVVATVLTLRGYWVAVASDGASAISASKHCEPDLLLLDITLRDMSGVTVLQTVRGLGLTSAAVALTALAFETDKRTDRDAGFDAVCAKPADVEHLLRILRNLVAPRLGLAAFHGPHVS
ncbi:protein of unknown function (plasmid) [Pararobbsia alpina]|uniref:response regulator n=1 Tax=Pararobbsia alpina TaxID=621374 RepID=UPI0039A6491F